MKKRCRPPRLAAASAVAGLLSVLSMPFPFVRLFAAEPDSLTRSVQSALHARGFFYGAVNGRPDPGTVEALRRFQIRQGLPVTGSPDKPTLHALGLAAAPDSPAARGASAGPPQEADRELLLREGLTKPVSPSAAPSSAGRRDTTTVVPAATPRPRAKPSPSPSPALAPAPRRPASTPAPQPAQTPKPPPFVARADVRGGEASSSTAAATFVRRYIALGAANNTDAELACFGDPVVYFNSGRIKRAFIRRDIEAYHRRWPERHFELDGEPAIVRVSSDNVATVRFRLAYRLQGAREHAQGRTDNEVRLRPGGSEGFEIVSVRERKL